MRLRLSRVCEPLRPPLASASHCPPPLPCLHPPAETDLHAVIRAGILEEVHKQYIIYQLLKALYYMHTAELIHRDIKPSNLLLNSDCHAKLCDFGLCRSVSELSTSAAPVLTDYVATRWYRGEWWSRAAGWWRWRGGDGGWQMTPCRVSPSCRASSGIDACAGAVAVAAVAVAAAPEILLGSTKYTKAVDMWAVGCILGEM